MYVNEHFLSNSMKLPELLGSEKHLETINFEPLIFFLFNKIESSVNVSLELTLPLNPVSIRGQFPK